MSAKMIPGRPGDRLEVASPSGTGTRRGEIVGVLGGMHHEHYRVRWDDGHESIHYPSEGTHITPAAPAAFACSD
ncbi:MAG TPA: DUF1918 domain-containing protein [Solirubrobacteraceae bacterium]|jgi:hypothetical protein